MINPKNYFIVDDDSDDRQFLMEALIKIDPSCQCRTASDGQEALADLIDRTIPLPDLIFLDLNMPSFNGTQCLIVLKQIHFLQQIPVVIYSTTSNEKEIQEIIEKGAYRFLVKKSSFTELLEELASIPIIAENNH